MTQTYEQDYLDALEAMKEDGTEVTLIKKGQSADPWEVDENGDPVIDTPDQFFTGYGIATNFNSYAIGQGIAKTGDAKLIFVANELSEDYLALYDSLSGSSDDEVFAVIGGYQWRVIGGSEVKPTETQILAKMHLRGKQKVSQ